MKHSHRTLRAVDVAGSIAAAPQGRFRLRFLLAGAVLVLAAGCAGGGGSLPGGPSRGNANISRALPAVSPSPIPADSVACTGPGSEAGCGVKLNPKSPPASSPSGGLTALQLRAAYGLPAISGSATADGPLIAVVDAFNDPQAEKDLAIYRAQFGLPACTSRDGCFRSVLLKKLAGDNAPPPAVLKKDSTSTATWADETALDLAMASAGCPTCRLLLVQADGQDLDSLAAAVNSAAAYGPAAISNSWGVLEQGNTTGIDAQAQAAFDHPGIAITASTGDAQLVQFPASSPYVTAVGGTTLQPDAATARGWSEVAWAQTGAGCSVMFPVPSWQGAATTCGGRAVPDVSVIADDNPGVAVYSSAQRGWVVLGGTSVGAPFVAGLYAAAGDYGSATIGAQKLYAQSASFNVLSGVTLGSPAGLQAF